MNEKGLGSRLQQARQAAGLTQQALCQKAGLSYSTLAKIERGAIKSPSIFTIQTIASVLNTSLDELIGTKIASKKRQKSKSGISFVYLDINGCLVRFYHQAFTKVSADADQPVDLVETAFWHYNDQICRGEITMPEFNHLVGKRLNIPDFNWADYYLTATKPMPKMHELVDWISKHYGIGLLTNIMPGLVEEMKKRKFIPDINYDAIIDSSKVHFIKPERKIYELAQREADCPANEILFVDDSRANLMAAEKLGWRVLWFDDTSPDQSTAHIREALELVQSL